LLGRADELVHGVPEHAAWPECVPRFEVDGSVHLGDDEALSEREQVDADEIAADRSCFFERESLGQRRRRNRLAASAERNVGSPLAGCRDSARSADDASAGYDDP
jgi:hypothetical protein